jgi:hypothetical protein
MRSWMTILGLLLITLLVPGAARAGSAEEIVDAMIEAHGGMETWASAPTVRFEDHFKPGESDSGRVSRITVEQGPRRAYIDFPGTDMRISWDGEKAWSENWQAPAPPRFLALLNYYFVNLPWLAKDPGVLLGEPGTGKLFDDPTEYVTVKMTYEAGVGDTPDDYYVLYVDPKTHVLKANRYIVTYRAILPEGVEALPEHILIYKEWTTVDGLLVPTSYTIYELDGSVYGSCDVSAWSFSDPFDASRMEMPEGAVVDESTP